MLAQPTHIVYLHTSIERSDVKNDVVLTSKRRRVPTGENSVLRQLDIKRGSRHAAHAAKALRWGVDQLL